MGDAQLAINASTRLMPLVFSLTLVINYTQLGSDTELRDCWNYVERRSLLPYQFNYDAEIFIESFMFQHL